MKIFVYGTLKPNEINFEIFFQARKVDYTPVIAKGKLYQIPFYTNKYPHGYPAMTLEEGWVKGYLFEFKDAEILHELDPLEGYQEGRSPEENEYQRLWLPIFDLQQQPLTEAWVYVMTQEKVEESGGFPLNRSFW